MNDKNNTTMTMKSKREINYIQLHNDNKSIKYLLFLSIWTICHRPSEENGTSFGTGNIKDICALGNDIIKSYVTELKG